MSTVEKWAERNLAPESYESRLRRMQPKPYVTYIDDEELYEGLFDPEIFDSAIFHCDIWSGGIKPRVVKRLIDELIER